MTALLVSRLEAISVRIAEVLEESSTELSANDNHKLESMLEDVLDIVNDLDKIEDVGENPPKLDVSDIIYDLQEDNSWGDY